MALIQRDQLCRPRVQSEQAKRKEDILFITTYDRHAEMMRKIILKEWHLLENDPKYGRLFKTKPRFVYKRGKNIGDQLTASDIRPKKIHKMSSTNTKGTYPCMHCQNCASVIKVFHCRSSTKGLSYKNSRILHM